MVLAVAKPFPPLSAPPLVPDELLTAWKSLDFQVKPAGRSVFPVHSSGLLDLQFCNLATEQLIIGRLCYYQLSSSDCRLVLVSIMPCYGQQSLAVVLVHLLEQPWT